MKKYLSSTVLFFILVLVKGYAAPTPTVTLYTEEELKTKIIFYLASDGSYLSDTPTCRSNACQASKILVSSTTMPRQKIELGEGGKNPADLLCQKLQGSNATYYNAESEEIAICVFPDNSQVFAWDLYRTHFHIKK